MSRNGSGTYSLPPGNPVVTGTTISSTWANNTLADMANAITGSIAADGQTTITGALKGPNGTVAFAGVGQTQIPSGTTAQRASSPVNGMIRFNTDLNQYEGYKNGAWSIFGNGAGGTLFSDTVTATQGQTVIDTPTGFVPGGDNLSVYVNGSRQIYNVNYTETTSTSFTFTNGLNAGDLVNYTIGASTALSVNASSVLYNEGSTNAVDTNVEAKLQETVSVKDFGAVGDGTTDDTTAINNGIAAALVLKQPLFFPAGTYLVTSTINIPVGTQLKGVKGDQYPNGYSVNPLATTINFQPTSPNTDLFVASGTTYGGFRFQYSIEGFYITSNSNARYGFNLANVIYGHFENITFNNTFTTAFYCNGTINNRFVNIYSTGTFSCVLYAGNNETTDVWEQCTFFGATIGVDFAGSSIAVRFANCLWEQMLSYGMRIAKECQGITVLNAYAEDVPYSNTASASMFNVGYVGTTVSSSEQLIVLGGVFSGRNAGTVGYFLDCNYCNGVQLIGATYNRFTQVINTTANTAVQSIRISSGAGVGFTTYANDFTKISGSYPNGVNNVGTPSLESRYINVNTNSITAADGNGSQISLAGAAIILGAGAANAVYPNTDNVCKLGLSSNRWSTVYAGTGTINTSDASQKTDIVDISDVEKRVAIKLKSSMKRFKFKDGKRYHFGTIAQDVKVAFESEGLIAEEYGIFCSDELENGTVQLGIRYDELFAFIISVL